MTAEGNSSDYKRGHFEGEVMTRLDSIDGGIRSCHQEQSNMREKFTAEMLANAAEHKDIQSDLRSLKARQKLITTGISASITAAVLGLKAAWDRVVNGGH